MEEEFLNFKERQYTKLESMGEGCFKVQHIDNNKNYIMFVRCKKSYVKSEFAMMQCASHTNILKAKEWFYGTKGKEIIITEYAESLESKIREATLSEEEMKPIVRDILKALVQLDKKKISHLDLKPANIFLKDNKAYFNNFGCACYHSNLGNLESPVGTIGYMSPEMLAIPNLDYKKLCVNDIYSLGVTIKQMRVGMDQENFETKATVELLRFVRSAMSNGTIRPNAKELLEHEWLKIEKQSLVEKLFNMFK